MGERGVHGWMFAGRESIDADDWGLSPVLLNRYLLPFQRGQTEGVGG